MSAPDDFDWSSEGRGTDLVRSIERLLAELSDKRQDAMRAELDLLATLSDKVGLVAAEQVCSGENIDIEGLHGIQDILLFLAIEHPNLINRIEVQASMSRRHGGQNWSTFQFENDGKPWMLESEVARADFLAETLSVLELPKHRKHVADWYETVRTHAITGEETTFTHATIYVEERAESELGFGASDTLERQVVAKVLEVGIACDPKSRLVEICARGGKKMRDQFSAVFSRNFVPHSRPPLEVPRRDVRLHLLKSPPDFEIFPSDGIARVEVSSLDFGDGSGGIARFEKRGEGETIYGFLDRRFGTASPLRGGGWTILSATFRIILAAEEGKRQRALTVTLRLPNTTTSPNTTESDRQFIFALLERWGLLALPAEDVDVLETGN
ncbi:hypothetical protein SLH49_07410 [Cognatiyoonia sp. IB215446]|uniref:hypothetical protein n=1 Tax=Cognatiyoonia sp. IB215446 TaxID=3097355 RepID=UPI002A185F44|nr:hypothetical protein [Cognatiyoonia sp. IB215446]MDX8347809.1 hypothetical protein [Cognatiyoonia sp. IB215446]